MRFLCTGFSKHHLKKLRSSQCKGSVAERAADLAQPHHLWQSGEVSWCAACGAFAETTPRLLLQDCRGSAAGGGITNLARLRKGWHPRKQNHRLPQPKALLLHNPFLVNEEGGSLYQQENHVEVQDLDPEQQGVQHQPMDPEDEMANLGLSHGFGLDNEDDD